MSSWGRWRGTGSASLFARHAWLDFAPSSLTFALTVFSLCSVIRTIFDSFDIEREGRIHINQLSSMLYKLGKKEGEPEADHSLLVELPPVSFPFLSFPSVSLLLHPSRHRGHCPAYGLGGQDC